MWPPVLTAWSIYVGKLPMWALSQFTEVFRAARQGTSWSSHCLWLLPCGQVCCYVPGRPACLPGQLELKAVASSCSQQRGPLHQPWVLDHGTHPSPTHTQYRDTSWEERRFGGSQRLLPPYFGQCSWSTKCWENLWAFGSGFLLDVSSPPSSPLLPFPPLPVFSSWSRAERLQNHPETSSCNNR